MKETNILESLNKSIKTITYVAILAIITYLIINWEKIWSFFQWLGIK